MTSARVMRPVVAIIMLAGVMAACLSVDGLSGGDVPDARSDDATGALDAESEADAQSPCDGGACAQADASGSGFCASRMAPDLLCADFDGTDVLAGWTGRVGASGSAGADDGGSTSPPFSLLTSVVRDGGTLPVAFVFKSFTQTVGAFHLELDVEALLATPFQYVRLTLGRYTLTLGVEPSGSQFVEEDVTFLDGGSARDIHAFIAPMTVQVWHHVVLDAVLTAPAKVDLHFDGSAVLSAEALSYASEANDQGKLSVGMLFVELGAYATRFDNVVFQPH